MSTHDYTEIFKKFKKREINTDEAIAAINAIKSARENISVLYGLMDWQEEKLMQKCRMNDIFLLVFNAILLPGNIKKEIEQTYAVKPFYINQSDSFKQVDAANFQLDFKSNMNLNQLFRFTGNAGCMKILYLLKSRQELNENNVQSFVDEEILPVFQLFKTVFDLKRDQGVEVILLYTVDSAYNNAANAAFAGLVRTVPEENGKVKARLIAIENWEDFMPGVVDELFAEDSTALEILYKNHTRYIKSFTEMDAGWYSQNTLPLKTGGIYLITGGMGGLGLVFTEFLTREYNANVIITGRSAPDAKKKERIEILKQHGGDIRYLESDITDKGDVKKLIDSIKAIFGRIDGIIHAAGIIKDNYINKKSAEEIRSVVMPKVAGALCLDIFTQKEDLDFFVLFSSLAVLGNPGQSDYSYANGFLNDFAALRNVLVAGNTRKGKTLAVDWPYWKEGGMRIDRQTLQMIKTTKGMIPLETADGIDALCFGLKTGVDHFLVLPGNKKKILSMLRLQEQNKSITSDKYESAAAPASYIFDKLEEFLVEVISGILKIEKKEIDVKADLSEYGLDSISFTGLANSINTQFNLNITPALFFEYSTIEALIKFLDKAYHAGIAAVFGINKVSVLDAKQISLFMETFLVEVVSEILKMNKQEINIEDDMSEYGLDSTSFTRLSNRLNEKFDLSLTPAIFFEYATIAALTRFLVEKFGAKIERAVLPMNKISGNSRITGREPSNTLEMTPGEKAMKSGVFDPGLNKAYEPAAIIGMCGIFPGADTLDEFWANLEQVKDCITEVPPERWDWKQYWGDPAAEENKTNVKWGGFIKDIDKFDAAFFAISPREAVLMDPQHRLFLETTWKTIEDAGYKPSDLYNSPTGIFIGVQNSEYASLAKANNISVEAYLATGNSHALLPNRISYFFNFKGPSEAIDAACASSLIAVHRAIQAIWIGDCTQAIAGGVNSLLDPDAYIALNKSGALSPDGHCRTFDKEANGYARAEGVGAVFLKPLKKALADHDHIYAVIKGAAENHGGRAKSLTAPNPNTQAELIIKAMTRADVDPATITYIETHGTGTSLGDPIEINGLKKAYQELYAKWNKSDYGKEKHCGLSSVKTNIGHLETGAGIAGLIKIILAMQHKRLPGTVHFHELNPYIELNDSPFYIVDNTQEWKSLKDIDGSIIPRRAGISSFGFGGANAHVILEEYISGKPVSVKIGKNEYLIKLSTKVPGILQIYAANLKQWLMRNQGNYSIADVEYTLLTGREEFEERLAFIVQNEKELIEKLAAFLDGKDAKNKSYYGSIKKKKRKTDRILDGTIGQKVIKELVMNKNLVEIAELWVSGISVDWNLLITVNHGNRIPLPTYPFEKKRYWISEIVGSEKNKKFYEQKITGYKKAIDSHIYIKDEWIEKELIANSQEFKMILLIDDNTKLCDSLKIIVKNKTIIFIKASGNFKEIDNYHYEINYQNQEDYKKLLNALCEKQIPIQKVIHNISKEIYTLNNIDAQLNNSLFSMFYLCQELFLLKMKDKIQILYLYNEEPDTIGNSNIYKSISGFARTACMESFKLNFKVIGINRNQLSESSEIIINELNAEEIPCEEIIYKEGKRYLKQYNEFSLNENNKVPNLLMENGVYIITGGAGGLGLLFAEFIARQVKARIVLAGRSQLKKLQEEKIEAIAKLGSEIRYIQADISKENDCRNLITKIKELYGYINGIIHSAGIIKDNYIVKKSIDEIRNVIAPKIYGTIYLDDFLKNEKLDFFVLFSSTSVMGNAGQSDYAFANCFLDSFAETRNIKVNNNMRYGKTLAINWPLWKEGGMHVDAKTEEYLYNSTGMKPLSTEKGLAAFINGLKDNVSHFMIIEGDTDKIRNKLFGRAITIYNKYNSQSGANGENNQAIIRRHVETDISNTIINILKTSENDLEKNKMFSELGFDSISFTELANQINFRYKINLTPATFYEYSDINTLTEYLVQQHTDAIIKSQDNSLPQSIQTKEYFAPEKKRGKEKINNIMQSKLVEIISDILRISASDIELDQNITQYGFDSISFTELANRLNRKYNTNITPATFYEYTTIKLLAEFMLENYPGKINLSEELSDNDQYLVNSQPVEKISSMKQTFLKESFVNESNSKEKLFEPIAIIGMAGYFPGAENPDELWEIFKEGKDCITEIPPDRWDWKQYWGDPAKEKNKTNVKWGGFIRDIDKFDAHFFGITPDEAAVMDPQQRIFLEIVWKTIEDAGYKVSDLSGSLTGVFAGVVSNDYLELLQIHNIPLDANAVFGNMHETLATRISYLFNFIGPSEAVVAASASSSIALHRAVHSIQSGDCTQAIAGGVNLLVIPESFIFLNNIGLVSKNGHCVPFSKNANGFVISEGVAAVFLKPLSSALQNRDHIYAIIKGSMENHGGKTNTPISPNPDTQAASIIKAMEKADIDPATITYIEAGSIASNIGDPIEINGLKKAYKQLYQKWNINYTNTNSCGIGSLKGNIGHLEAASGITGIIKVLLAMKNKKIPGILHYNEINPYVTLDDSPFYIVKDTQEWKQLKDKSGALLPRRAGINSFSFISHSVHVILEEYIAETEISNLENNNPQIIVLSAKTEDALNKYIIKLKSFIENSLSDNVLSIGDIAFTLQTGREAMEHRFAIIAISKQELLDKIKMYINKENMNGIFQGKAMKKKFIIKESEGNQIIQLLIKKNYEQITRLWVEGINVDWLILHADTQPQRIALPTYPFNKQRHWITPGNGE